MRFHRGRVYFVRWDNNPVASVPEVAAELPGARRINDIWYTPVQPYRSGDTAVDAEVLCKCHAFVESSKYLLQTSSLIPSDFLYDVAQGRTPFFFRPLPDPAETSC